MRCLLTGAVVGTLITGAIQRPLAAQWAAGAELGASRFWGGSVELTEAQRSFRPYRPTVLAARLQREGGTLGVGMALEYFSAGLALAGAEGHLVANDIFTVYGLAPELLYRLAALGANRVLIRAGPLLEVWKIIDEGSEVRLGLQAGLSLYVPLGGRFEGTVAGGVAVVPSPFSEGQLDASFERRPLWRRSVAVGLQYRL